VKNRKVKVKSREVKVNVYVKGCSFHLLQKNVYHSGCKKKEVM
jgi:hypothetical protein